MPRIGTAEGQGAEGVHATPAPPAPKGSAIIPPRKKTCRAHPEQARRKVQSQATLRRQICESAKLASHSRKTETETCSGLGTTLAANAVGQPDRAGADGVQRAGARLTGSATPRWRN